MKFGNILLTCSFFVHVAGGAPMRKTYCDEKYGNRGYGSYQETGINRRESDANEEEKEQQQRSSGMTTAVDSTMREQKDLTIDSSEELINQKREEALNVAQKWSAQLEQKSSSINEEEMTTILQEATADFEYWNDQKKKISSWFGEDGSEETKVADLAKGTLFLELSKAATMAIEQAYNVAACYGSLSDADPRTSAQHLRLSGSSSPLYGGDAGRIRQFISERKPPPVQSSLEIGNPLITSWASDSRSQQPRQLENNGQKLIKSPSKEYPLIADTLKEALETWCGNAEIKYDVAVRKYKSDSFQPNNMFDAIRYAAGRSQQERKQNRDTIEKVALEGGADYAVRFKSYFSIRVKNAFGEPLTPELIKKINKDLRFAACRAAQNVSDLQSQRSAFNSFLESIATRWEAFLQGGRDRSPYAIIPSEDGEVESGITHHRQVHSSSYQAL
ncbi:MAG: hypothetical protein K2W97_00965 [Chthoniobacterales bacterium]|nr:hypothetical protein [Chthoniobacterales bacterium]